MIRAIKVETAHPAEVRHYVFAVVTTAAAFAITSLLGNFLAPMRLFFPWCAILATAIYGGMGPAVVAIILSATGVAVFTFPPFDAFRISNPQDLIRIAMFATFSAALSLAVSARKRAQERASGLSRWLSTTFESIGDAVIATDTEGQVVFLNRVAQTLTGWEPASALRRPVAEIFRIVHEETRAAAPDPVQRVLKERAVVGISNHTLLIDRNGVERPIDDSAAPIVANNGELLGAVLVFHDVSERRALERARERALADLLVAERKYRTLVEATPVPQAVWTATNDGRIHWSEEWLAITGQTLAELEANEGLKPIHPDDARRAIARWRECVATGNAFQDEVRVRTPADRYRWFTVRAVPLRADDGTVQEWVGVVADIHDRKQREDDALFINRATALLAASLDYEETLRTLAKLCVPLLGDWCAIDIATTERDYRRVAVEHTDAAKAKSIFELDARYRSPRDLDPIVQALKSGEAQVVPEIPEGMLESLTVNDEHLEIARSLGLCSWMIAPMIARGRTIGCITLVSAESQRHYTKDDLHLLEDLAGRAAMAVDNARLFQEASAASRAKDEFLATLSHELRTPLTAIVGWAGVLLSGDVATTTHTMALETIMRSGRSLAELVDELLDLSRSSAGKLTIEVSTVDLKRIADDAVNAARPVADTRTVHLSLTSTMPVLLVRGDAGRLRQVLTNLISNALKFTPTDGRIEVRLSTRDDRAVIEVADTGIGIDPEFLPHVWERFRQADMGTSRAFGGLGLGLAIVRHLVEAHGGEASARSEGHGKGATFTVTLPLAMSATPVLSHKAEDSSSLLQKRELLLVDDDEESRTVLTAMLRQYGAIVTPAATAREALGVLAARPCHAVITDLAMPEVDGFALLSQIREKSTIPVIAISAAGSGADVLARVRDAGFSAFISKPVEPGDLARVVAEHV